MPHIGSQDLVKKKKKGKEREKNTDSSWMGAQPTSSLAAIRQREPGGGKSQAKEKSNDDPAI